MTKKQAARINHQEAALLSLGFTRQEADSLRRISRTLHKWAEYECGTSEGQTTISIERDGDHGDGKPYKRIQYPTAHGYVDRRWPIADRERGALKRLVSILARRNASVLETADDWDATHTHPTRSGVAYYVQGDPRGCALYILRPGDVPEGQDESAYYSRGIAVA